MWLSPFSVPVSPTPFLTTPFIFIPVLLLLGFFCFVFFLFSSSNCRFSFFFPPQPFFSLSPHVTPSFSPTPSSRLLSYLLLPLSSNIFLLSPLRGVDCVYSEWCDTYAGANRCHGPFLSESLKYVARDVLSLDCLPFLSLRHRCLYRIFILLGRSSVCSLQGKKKPRNKNKNKRTKS